MFLLTFIDDFSIQKIIKFYNSENWEFCNFLGNQDDPQWWHRLKLDKIVTDR